MPAAATVALAVLLGAPAASQAAPTTWLVGSTPGAHASRAAPGAQVAPGIRVVRGDSRAASRLKRLPGVRWVERNRRFQASGSAPATDPLQRSQWALSSARVPGAWPTTLGRNVTVAVLDSGIDASNPELSPNLWTNAGEISGNGIDDDANGFVDDVHGADLVNGDGDPADGFGHGTAVASVIGAPGDNGIGMSGVAWRVRLMPVKVLRDNGFGNTVSVIAGLRYALAGGARVINMSLNGAQPSLALEEAIGEAEAAGALIVTSAGNDGGDRDRVASYPASIESSALLTVASTNRTGALGYASAFGRNSVDIAAPGEDVLTGALGGGYTSSSGTSFSAAHVSGAAALLAAARPDASGPQLRRALVASARRGGRVDSSISGGQLDVTAALRRLVPPRRAQRRPARPRSAR